MAVVKLENVSKRYPGSQELAVDAINLDIADGEFLVLLGPSGCGKSTALRMIAGLESITRGTLYIDGQAMNHIPAKDRDIAMVFQSYMNRTVIFGIRPEDLSEIQAQDRHQQPNGFTTRVAAVEALGAETVLITEIEAVDEVVRARLDRDSTARLGDEICIEVDVNRVHLFDPESSQAIACR